MNPYSEQLAPLIVRVNDILSQAEEAIDRAMGFVSPIEMELEDNCSSRRAQASYDRMVDYVNEVCGKIHQLKKELSHVQP